MNRLADSMAGTAGTAVAWPQASPPTVER